MAAAAASACASHFPRCSMPSMPHRPWSSMASIRPVYWKVVEHCYLCDMCYMTKCPYVPPHPWNVDFPHLMLRAKAVRASKGELKLGRTDAQCDRRGRPHRWHPGRGRDRQCGQPQSPRAQAARQDARRGSARAAAAVSREQRARSPQAHVCARTCRSQASSEHDAARWCCSRPAMAIAMNPSWREDLAAVFEHNGIGVVLAPEGALLRHAEARARRSASRSSSSCRPISRSWCG